MVIPDRQKRTVLSRSSTGNSYWQEQAISHSQDMNMLGLLIEKEGRGEYLHRRTPFVSQKEKTPLHEKCGIRIWGRMFKVIGNRILCL